ncbi:MAG: hypothetical protein IT366_06315 [Candidatus Hydrogenedentes bacterium]|nr:hypothetical protein [Candidatus Hydrogenedentota bacterium]
MQPKDDEESEEYLEYLRRELAIGLQEEAEGKLEPFDAEEIAAECRRHIEYLRREVALGLDDIRDGRVQPLDMKRILDECHDEWDKRSR